MIQIIEGSRRAEYPLLLDQMFEQRRRVFHDRLKWDVRVDERGHEKDEYDDGDSVYLLAVASGGRVTGSARLRPTTIPHMMTGPFASMFPDIAIRSATIWECTRLTAEDGVHRAGGYSDTIAELMTGIVEFAIDYGITQIIGIFERPMMAVYRKLALRPSIIGRSESTHGTILLGLWDIDINVLGAVTNVTGSTMSVIARQDDNSVKAA